MISLINHLKKYFKQISNCDFYDENQTHFFIGKTTNATIYWCNKNKHEINWGSRHCLLLSNGVVSVPLEGALVAGVGTVFHFVSVTSAGGASAAATAAAVAASVVVVVVGSPSVTTVSLLKTFKLELRFWDWGNQTRLSMQIKSIAWYLSNYVGKTWFRFCGKRIR